MTRQLNIDNAYNDTVDRRPAGNSGFAKKRVQWLIEHSTPHQLLCYVDSFELRNPLLRKAAKRYAQCQDTVPTMNRHTKQMTGNQRFVKLKEVQADTQSQRFCTTFNFTQTHNCTSNFYKKH
jgi:hypothetical protein